MTTRFDAIIIGTGQAGPNLAQRLSGTGMKVAVVERKLFGGTCVNTGCTPTKTMVASAYAAHIARRSADYGVTIPGAVTVDMRRVKERKDAIALASRAKAEDWVNETATVYRGHELRHSGEVLGASQSLIARFTPHVGADDFQRTNAFPIVERA
jgi:pyruvate/2-oxoglutarate dehydrogenase complex dihydrolipoamide dehydrogenase (E3) component